jgi:hypothetical protein
MGDANFKIDIARLMPDWAFAPFCSADLQRTVMAITIRRTIIAIGTAVAWIA